MVRAWSSRRKGRVGSMRDASRNALFFLGFLEPRGLVSIAPDRLEGGTPASRGTPCDLCRIASTDCCRGAVLDAATVGGLSLGAVETGHDQRRHDRSGRLSSDDAGHGGDREHRDRSAARTCSSRLPLVAQWREPDQAPSPSTTRPTRTPRLRGSRLSAMEADPDGTARKFVVVLAAPGGRTRSIRSCCAISIHVTSPLPR